jgi:hypothetical protein
MARAMRTFWLIFMVGMLAVSNGKMWDDNKLFSLAGWSATSGRDSPDARATTNCASFFQWYRTIIAFCSTQWLCGVWSLCVLQTHSPVTSCETVYCFRRRSHDTEPQDPIRRNL